MRWKISGFPVAELNILHESKIFQTDLHLLIPKIRVCGICICETILEKLKRLSMFHRVHLQWIPSHVVLEGNEITHTLTKEGACYSPIPSEPLTYSELFSRIDFKNKVTWIVPRKHHWYRSNCDRLDIWYLVVTGGINLLSLASSVVNLRSLSYTEGSKCLGVCTRCSTEQVSP